jgi:5-carboxymethyl-2-hydroxymuconate isomerase
MPLVNIDLLAGRTDQDLRQIGDSVHQAMVEQLNVPQRDRFQVVTQHSAATLQFDRHYLDIERTDQFVMVRVTLSAGRTAEAKARSTGGWRNCWPSASSCGPKTWRSSWSRTSGRTGHSDAGRRAT